MREVHIEKGAATDWNSNIREMCSVILSQPRKIGGVYEENEEILARFIEVDEFHICRRKYNVGKLLAT